MRYCGHTRQGLGTSRDAYIGVLAVFTKVVRNK
jgi:hypothetical protein